MSRLRADLHESWEDRADLKRFRRLLATTPPDECLARFGLSEYNEEEQHKALKEECERIGVPLEDVRHYWHKGKHFSIFSKNKGAPSYAQIREELIDEMEQYAPSYPTIERQDHSEGHLLVVDPADIHIGKIASALETGEEYNCQIAVQRAIEGVQGIISKAMGFGIDKVLFIAGNDILHTDTPRKTTTSGTPQDTDGMWYDHFTLGRKLNVDIIEMLMQVADVEVAFCPSNHDFMSGFFLMDAVACWFRNCDQVNFNVDISHRKYFDYGENLIGVTHGDGAKEKDLPLLMAQEAGEKWLRKHKYIYTHHVHHKTSKEYMGICVESLRSPSGTDGWHHRRGYQHSAKAVEGFIHHKKHGQIARLTHIF